MCRASFTPAVYKLSCTTGETCSHVGITKGKDRSVLVYTFCYNKLEVTISILCDCQVGNRTSMWIELCQIAAACLSVEYLNDLHGWLLCRDISIAASRVTNDTDVIVKVDGVHFRKLSCSRNCF